MKFGILVLALLLGTPQLHAKSKELQNIEDIVVCWDVKEKKGYFGVYGDNWESCDSKGRSLTRESGDECRWNNKPLKCSNQGVGVIAEDFDSFKTYQDMMSRAAETSKEVLR